MRALGIDVGVRKGLDVVLMDGSLRPLDTRRRVRTEDLRGLIEETRPEVVAIDSPPGWGADGRSRLTEREIRRFGIQSYGTPGGGRDGDRPFYDWMRVGFGVFRAAEASGFPRWRTGPVKGTSIEVFPHATAVVLAGCLPPPGAAKREWRAAVLRAHGVATEELRSADQVDAALAAFTGVRALQGRRTALGDPAEGVIVLPVTSLPARAYRRCPPAATPDGQPRLPGMTPCACGDPECRALTKGEFAPGHDAKRKSRLWRQARLGDEAVQELRRRGWEVPPEMR